MLATSLALKKAKLTTETGKSLSVLFNPDEYTIERSVSYASHAVPGLDIPIAQFVNGSADTLRMPPRVRWSAAESMSARYRPDESHFHPSAAHFSRILAACQSTSFSAA